jgi:hypothetical protein
VGEDGLCLPACLASLPRDPVSSTAPCTTGEADSGRKVYQLPGLLSSETWPDGAAWVLGHRTPHPTVLTLCFCHDSP